MFHLYNHYRRLIMQVLGAVDCQTSQGRSRSIMVDGSIRFHAGVNRPLTNHAIKGNKAKGKEKDEA